MFNNLKVSPFGILPHHAQLALRSHYNDAPLLSHAPLIYNDEKCELIGSGDESENTESRNFHSLCKIN